MPSAQGREVAQQVFELKRKVEQEKRQITSVYQPHGAQPPSIASGLALAVCEPPRQRRRRPRADTRTRVEREVDHARRALSAALVGRLTFTPHTEWQRA